MGGKRGKRRGWEGERGDSKGERGEQGWERGSGAPFADALQNHKYNGMVNAYWLIGMWGGIVNI